MKKYTAAEIAEAVELHGKWLDGENGGKRADFSYCDLNGARLDGARLDGARLDYASLDGARLNGASLVRASLVRASLVRARLNDASLDGADLRCMGNMRNIKTIQVDTWWVGYTNDTLQIGCQRHLIAEWQEFSDQEIGRMDSKALTWWKVWKPIIMAMIEASPAEPT